MSEFREQCERNLRRSVADRMRYGFNYVYKPILDDVAWRSFDSMVEYRQWCNDNLPTYLGYCDASILSPKQLDEARETFTAQLLVRLRRLM